MVERHEIAIAIVVLVAAAGLAFAATSTFWVGEETTINAYDGPEVTFADETELEDPTFPDSHSVATAHGILRSDSTGPSVRISGVEDDRTTLEDIDVSDEALEIDFGDPHLEIDGGVYELDFEEGVSELDTGDGTVRYDASGSFSLTVHDITEEGRVGAKDSESGDMLDTAMVSDGVVTFDDLPAGDHEVELVDAPDVLHIRDVHSQEIIEDASVTVEFFGGDLITEEETTDGTVDMTDVPAEEDIIISVSSDGYHDRSTIIPTILDQQNVYLLEDSTDVDDVRILFELDDYSGQFDRSGTRLLIQRPLQDESSERRWKNVIGESFGAAGEVVATLERNQRYRLIIENDDGLQRSLGDYTASETGTAILEVGTIEWTAETDTYRWHTEYQNTSEGDYIEFMFQDESGTVEDLEVSVYERGNESNVIYEDTEFGIVGDYSAIVDIPAGEENRTWTVEWSAKQDGEEIGTSRVVSDQLSVLDNPFDGTWGMVAVAVILIFVGLMFGGVFGAIGSVIVSSVATLLWWMGWFPISGAVILAALLVGVLYVVGGDRP